MFIASRTRCLIWAAMSNHAKYFSASGNGAMRVTGLPVARPALCRCRASRARIAIAPARSYAKAFHPATRRLWTGADNLPRLPRLRFKKSGQRKPNRYAMPRPPRPAPTIFNVCRMKKRGGAACVVCGQRIKLAPQNRVCATRPCNSKGTSWQFLFKGNGNLGGGLRGGHST